MHLLLLWLFTQKFNKLKFLPPTKQEKKISLNLKQIVTPPSAPKAKPIPKPTITPPVVKPIIKKKVVPVPKAEEPKKTILDERKKTFATKSTKENNVTKAIKKSVKKEIKKESKPLSSQAQSKKRITQKRKSKRRTKRSKDPLANMLMGSGTSLNPRPSRRSSNTGAYGERMIKQLYGSEFNTFSSTQKKYIRNNLSTIHQITQRTLSRNGYPAVSIRTRQQGTNIVSFYLHPNGDITGLRLKKHIGYEALDSNTLKVIRLAYKDYPLPNQKTKITFYVQYSIY